MNYYLEITLINNKEFGFSRLWTAVYTQLHLAFVEQKDADEKIAYGVSFPEYVAIDEKHRKDGKKVFLLGSKLRVFAQTQAELEALNLPKWFERLTDYVHLKSIKPVPEEVAKHVQVSRYRPPPRIDKLARRFAQRKKISYEDALLHYQDFNAKICNDDYPYIQIKSLEGGQTFSLCIQQKEVAAPRLAKFSTYGLSAAKEEEMATVPHW